MIQEAESLRGTMRLRQWLLGAPIPRNASHPIPQPPHMATHNPKTANFYTDTDTQTYSQNPWLHRCVPCGNAQQVHTGLPTCLCWYKHSDTQRPAQGAVTYVHGDGTYTQETHTRNTQPEPTGGNNWSMETLCACSCFRQNPDF